MVLIVRFMHVPQLPSEGDAKGLRHLFKVRQSRAICRGCRRAPEDTHSLLESGCVVIRVTVANNNNRGFLMTLFNRGFLRFSQPLHLDN